MKKDLTLYREISTDIGGGSGATTSEYFNFEEVKAYRTELKTALDTAVGHLKTGSTHIDEGFSGGAMAGGSANAIKNKWDDLVKTMNEFNQYIVDTIDLAQTVGVNNEAFEAEVKKLFSTTDNFAGGGAAAPMAGSPADLAANAYKY